jgi:predicted glycoside hydrolase/deacetylase ChbG (UPF0249 family)
MQVIVNADDFGWDEEANKGILALCAAGKLQGVSIMANYAQEEWIEKLLPFQAQVRLGLHLVLNEGLPLSPREQVPTLVDKNGQFYSSAVLWRRFLLGKINKEHVRTEIKAQAQKLRNNGIALFHADSHQHIHHLPFLGKIILDTLQELGITSVRNSLPSDLNDRRRNLLYFFCQLTKKNLAPFVHNDVLMTYLASHSSFNKGEFDRELAKWASKNTQTLELMCHPALSNRNDSYLRRREEFDFLMQGVSI